MIFPSQHCFPPVIVVTALLDYRSTAENSVFIFLSFLGDKCLSKAVEGGERQFSKQKENLNQLKQK